MWILGFLLGIVGVYADKPHIVVILADDLGWNDLGFKYTPNHVSPPLFSPEIDLLAQSTQSVILESLYSMPMCTPSRASLMTGRHPTRNGLHHFILLANQPTGLPLSETTLPSILKQSDYRTHMVGKWHLGFASRAFLPTHRGFDSFFGYTLGAQDYFTHDSDEWLVGKKAIVRAQPVHGEGTNGLDYYRDDEPIRRDQVEGQHGELLIAREAESVIRSHATGEHQSKPLFLYIASQAPHANFKGAPQRFYSEFDRMVNETGSPAYTAERREMGVLVLTLDELVGRVVDCLTTHGMMDDTLLLFMSDNGAPPTDSGGSTHPLRGYKRTLWEGGVRSASFIRFPRNMAHQLKTHRYDGLMHFTDLFSSLVSVGQATLPQANHSGSAVWPHLIDGLDMIEAIITDSPSPRTEMLVSFDQVVNCSALRINKHKLVVNGHCMLPSKFSSREVEREETDESPSEVELFDLSVDPGERHNIAKDHPSLVRMMLARLGQYAGETAGALAYETSGDPMASPQLHGGSWVPWLDEEPGSCETH